MTNAAAHPGCVASFPVRTIRVAGVRDRPNDRPIAAAVHPAARLFSAAARMGQDPARQVCHREREEQPVEVHLNGAGQDPVRGELFPGKARTRRGDVPQRPPGQRIRIFTFSLTGSFTSPAVLCTKRGLGGRAG